MTKALSFPVQKEISKMAGISDRTLRTYNKVSLRESLDPYIKLMSGFKDNGVLDSEGVDEHLESMKSGGFKGFYFESLYQRISIDMPDFIRNIHYSVCFYDSWSELADQRNIPEKMFKEIDNDEAIEWLKGLYPYNKFDLDFLFDSYLKGSSVKGSLIDFEIGFSMLAALAMDVHTASNKKFDDDDLILLVKGSLNGKKLISQFFKLLRDECFSGTKEEFYEEYARNSMVGDGDDGPIYMDKDDAKRTYIRMCSNGAADWKQIIRVAHTVYGDQPKEGLALALRFALLKCINLYVKRVGGSEVVLTEKVLKGWTKKWTNSFWQHSPLD